MAAPLHRMLWRQLQPRSTATTSPLLLRAGPLLHGPTAPSGRAAARSTWLSSPPASRRAYSSRPRPPQQTTVKFWPFVAVIALGTGSYILLVNQRAEENMPAINPPDKPAGEIPAPAKTTPTFSGDDVTVVFVLGGPGAGKGTQCARLVAEYGFTHLSAGDLLRAEQARPGSQFGGLIRDYIKEGKIVPLEVTVQLLENAMAADMEARHGPGRHDGRFLIDGFPRKMDQALKFEEAVCPAQFVLFFDCPEAELERRLLERGKTSGRSDDNAESIRKRFRTFVDTSMPVVDHYDKEGRVIKVDATPPPDDVFKKTQEELAARMGKDF